MKSLMEGKMEKKFKNLFFGMVALVVVVAYLMVSGGAADAMAAGPADKGAGKGGGVSDQATAGDVPPIVMTPHGSVEELKPKLSKEFELYLPEGVSLHGDNTLKEVGLTLRSRTEASKIIKRRKLSDFKSGDFYVLEAMSFLRKYSGMLGLQNLENSIKFSVRKKKRTGGTELKSNIYIYGYLLENSLVRVAIGPDDTFIGARFKLPHITPEMYRAVKAAKDNVKTLEEIKVLAGKKFIEKALAEGLITGGSSEEAEKMITWTEGPGMRNPKVPRVVDFEPYIVWSLELYTDKDSPLYNGVWVLDVDAVTGDIVKTRNINYGEKETSED